MLKTRLYGRRIWGWALAMCVLGSLATRDAQAQSSLYRHSPYHSSPYRTSPYRPDYSPSAYAYGPRNYSGLMSNYDYRRPSPAEYVNALYSTPALYGGWNYRWPWGAGLPYSLRYGLGFRGPYYPNYYYGYSNFYRPWYRSYRPFGVGISGWPLGFGWGIGGLFGPGYPGGLAYNDPWIPGAPLLPGAPLFEGMGPGCASPLENAPLNSAPLPTAPLENAPVVEEVVPATPRRIYGGLYYW